MMKRLYIVAAVLLLASCSPRVARNVETVAQKNVASPEAACMPHPSGFDDRYTLDGVVVLSRHNIRSPLSGKGSVLSRITPHEWFDWSSLPGELSLRGGALEIEMGQYFKHWLEAAGLFPKDAVPEAGTVRFYANSIQRTRATARAFVAGMFPMADIAVEQHTPLGTMDPVFHPQITKVTDRFLSKAYAEIEAMGGLDAPVKAKYTLLENVLDIKASPAARNDTTSFGQFPSAVRFEMNKEPIMTGGLKMACSASDALTLQYYEEQDELKAGFGHALTRQEWTDLSSVKDWYQDVLFAVPSVAVNVAHPMLKELLSELRAPGRKFTFLCGHDSNIGSVLAALRTAPYQARQAIETKTPIGGKIVLCKWRGRDGKLYADLWLLYASADQLRELTLLGPDCPPMSLRLELEGLTPNADGLYLLEAVEGRFKEAIDAYDQL